MIWIMKLLTKVARKVLKHEIIQLQTSSIMNRNLVERYKDRLLEYQLRIRQLETENRELKAKEISSNNRSL